MSSVPCKCNNSCNIHIFPCQHNCVAISYTASPFPTLVRNGEMIIACKRHFRITIFIGRQHCRRSVLCQVRPLWENWGLKSNAFMPVTLVQEEMSRFGFCMLVEMAGGIQQIPVVHPLCAYICVDCLLQWFRVGWDCGCYPSRILRGPQPMKPGGILEEVTEEKN